METAYASLAPGGIFVAHLDPINLRDNEDVSGKPSLLWNRLLRGLKAQGVQASFGSFRLRIEKTSARLEFGVRYRGPAPLTPNFSGMLGVDSWYESKDE